MTNQTRKSPHTIAGGGQTAQTPGESRIDGVLAAGELAVWLAVAVLLATAAVVWVLLSA
jgi:hypothetical protein